MGTMSENGQRKRIFNTSSNAANILGKEGKNTYTFSHIYFAKRICMSLEEAYDNSLKTASAFAAMLIFPVF